MLETKNFYSEEIKSLDLLDSIRHNTQRKERLAGFQLWS